MLSMILKMSGMTLLYVFLAVVLNRWLKNKKLTAGHICLIGVIFGCCSVLSTHFGIDYNHMLVNVRDIGPLAAGFFFHPVSGIIAGLIGGIERYIAGTCWNLGAYTTIACSVSTVLAGFLAAFLNRFVFKREKPSAPYAFFMGAVMEVFHMYAIFFTHRNDMSMAFYVVRNCSIPMITFTAFGVGLSAFILNYFSKEHHNISPFKKKEKRSISERFQIWLFIVTLSIVAFNFFFTFSIQTRNAFQSARGTLNYVAQYIKESYKDMEQMDENITNLVKYWALTDTLAINQTIRYMGGLEKVDEDFLLTMKLTFNLLGIAIIDENGEFLYSVGRNYTDTTIFDNVLSGKLDFDVKIPSSRRVCAAVHVEGCVLEAVFAMDVFDNYLDLDQMSDTLSAFHFGTNGTFDIVRKSGYIEIGSHSVTILTGEDREEFMKHSPGELFESTILGPEALCLIESLDADNSIFLRLPIEEVYLNRDIQAYESALETILIFAGIYVLVSLLVQSLVIDNLKKVNLSLGKITNGDLNEVVSVRNSTEFVSLSDDINQTVTVLKGYIDAAEHRMEQELELAKAIQASALPRNFSFPRTDFEIYALMNPAKEVGGDFYDFFFVEHNRLALVIADVSGKGIPAALFMMQSKVAIRNLAEAGNSPSEICFKCNNMLCENNDAKMFVTVWIGIIDLETGLMKCANAGHEYPAIMRANGDYELFKDKHGLVLGAMEDIRFKEYEILFNPQDRLFVYTDGVPEAIDEKTEAYGTQRMTAVLNTLKDLTVEQELTDLRQDIRDFVGNADQFDDITMLGFRYYGFDPEK